MEINNIAPIMIYKGELFENLHILNEFDIILITQIIELSKAELIDDFCRKNNKGFIYTTQLGFAFFLFEDFGDDFMVIDKNGKKCKNYFIKSISNACPGVVEIDPVSVVKNGKKKKKYLKLETGDFVLFKKITGMTELNDTPPRPIRILSKTKFTIEETLRFDEFMGSGIVEEVKIPFPATFKSLSEAKKLLYFENIIENKIIDEKIFDIEYDEMIDDEIKSNFDDNTHWMNILNISNKNETLITDNNAKMHLAVLSLHEFYSLHRHLPNFNEQKEINECLDICTKIFSKSKLVKEEWANDLSEIDKKYYENLFKFCQFSILPFSEFFGGIVSQEILKFIGLYKPACQWIYLNPFNLISNNFLNFEKILSLNDESKVDIELYMSNDQEKIKLLKKINFVIIGFNDIGFNIAILLNKLNLGEKITIVGLNKNENYQKICNLKETYNFNIIVDKDVLNNLSQQKWWMESKIIIDTFSIKFNSKEKSKLIEISKEFDKILISINANRYNGSYELFLPESLLNKKSNNNSKDLNTPEGNNEKNKYNDEEDLKYKNILNLKEAIKYSKKIFENYFDINIKHLNELIKKSNSESEMNEYINELMKKGNDKIKILKLIRYLKKVVSLKVDISFETIVLNSIETFQEIFEFSIDEILQKYPEDFLELGTLKKFWSGKRFPPRVIKFDMNNREHLQLVSLIAQFYCQILDKKNVQENLEIIKDFAKKYEMKHYDISIPSRAKSEQFFNIEKNSLFRFLEYILKNNKMEFKEIKLNIENNDDINDFEKLNNHLKFIILSSNLFLNNYGIELNNTNFKDISLLFKQSNILPSLVSTISGIIVIQILLMLNDPDFNNFITSYEKVKININDNETIDKKDDKITNNNFNSLYKNGCFNLASNIHLLYDAIF